MGAPQIEQAGQLGAAFLKLGRNISGQKSTWGEQVLEGGDCWRGWGVGLERRWWGGKQWMGEASIERWEDGMSVLNTSFFALQVDAVSKF